MASPKVNKENKMGIQNLVGKRITKTVKFMNEDVQIKKLNVDEVLEIQVKAKGVAEDDSQGFEVLRHVIKVAVEGAEALSDQDFNTFPMDELSKLSNEIMKFSGLGGGETGK
jgi:hypothetical protein